MGLESQKSTILNKAFLSWEIRLILVPLVPLVGGVNADIRLGPNDVDPGFAHLDYALLAQVVDNLSDGLGQPFV